MVQCTECSHAPNPRRESQEAVSVHEPCMAAKEAPKSDEVEVKQDDDSAERRTPVASPSTSVQVRDTNPLSFRNS